MTYNACKLNQKPPSSLLTLDKHTSSRGYLCYVKHVAQLQLIHLILQPSLWKQPVCNRNPESVWSSSRHPAVHSSQDLILHQKDANKRLEPASCTEELTAKFNPVQDSCSTLETLQKQYTEKIHVFFKCRVNMHIHSLMFQKQELLWKTTSENKN